MPIGAWLSGWLLVAGCEWVVVVCIWVGAGGLVVLYLLLAGWRDFGDVYSTTTRNQIYTPW
jgi:hypothetical protein